MIEYNGKKVLISDILHDAADIFLRQTRDDLAPAYLMKARGEYPHTKFVLEKSIREAERFSCCAVDAAIAYKFGLERWSDKVDKISKDVKKGLRNMGCPTGSSTAFSKYGDDWRADNTKVQGMRYMWLKWAAMMAEEQGV